MARLVARLVQQPAVHVISALSWPSLLQSPVRSNSPLLAEFHQAQPLAQQPDRQRAGVQPSSAALAALSAAQERSITAELESILAGVLGSRVEAHQPLMEVIAVATSKAMEWA